MADKDPEENLSLQLPSFGFGRKKAKNEPEASQPVEPDPEPAEPVEPAPTPATEPAPTPTPMRTAKRAPKPATTAKATPKPARTPKPKPTAEPDLPAPPVTPAPLAPELDAEAAEPPPGPVPARGRVEGVEPFVRPPDVATATPTEQIPAEQVPADPEAKRGLSFPAIPALQAVLAVGALVGILGVLLTFASIKFCELVRGTDSCGGPGWLLLAATLVALTYVGAWLLRGFGIDDPGSTSFLAVALLAVMTTVFFLDVIYSWWLIFVIPLVSMAMYALSWRVTSYVDTDDGRT